MTYKSKALVPVAALVATLASCWQSSEALSEVSGQEVQQFALDAPAQPLTRTGNLGRLCKWTPGHLGVDLLSNETDPASGKLMRWSAGHSVSFGLEGVAARHADDLFLLGRNRADEMIVERWSISPTIGGYGTSRPEPGTAIGVPAALTQSSAYINGPTFLPLSERSRGAPAQRTEVARLQGMGSLVAVVADPEGRFLLLLTRSDTDVVSLYQLALVPQAGVPLLLASSNQHPELADADQVNVIERAGHGRVYYAGRGLIFPALVLTDVANSGAFDSISGMTGTAFMSAHPQNLWSSPFF